MYLEEAKGPIQDIFTSPEYILQDSSTSTHKRMPEDARQQNKHEENARQADAIRRTSIYAKQWRTHRSLKLFEREMDALTKLRPRNRESDEKRKQETRIIHDRRTAGSGFAVRSFTGGNVVKGDPSAGERLLHGRRDIARVAEGGDGHGATVTHCCQGRAYVLGDQVRITSPGNLAVLDVPPHRRLRRSVLPVRHPRLLPPISPSLSPDRRRGVGTRSPRAAGVSEFPWRRHGRGSLTLSRSPKHRHIFNLACLFSLVKSRSKRS